MATQQPQRVRTADRGPPGDGPPLGGTATDPLVVGDIGPNRSLLPDGSMLCRNVPIARTGWMHYMPGETPIEPSKQPGASPVCFVHRGPEALFADEFMRSVVGIAIVHEHPPVPVTPANFAHLGKGFVLRCWRGDGQDSDCLMADLIIKDKWLIEQIDRNKREVSLGYEAHYEQTGEGKGEQSDLLANHLALVEKGRCGPRCAIGDEDTISSTVINEDIHMTTQAKPGTRARIPLTEARARVADALADLENAETAEDKGVTVHVHLGAEAKKEEEVKDPVPTEKAVTLDAAVEERFTKIEAGQSELKGTLETILKAVTAGGAAAPQKTEATEEDLETISEATATMDSAALANGYQQFVAQAEILAPGFKLPTFDAAAKRHATVDRMCNGRRAVLGALQASAEGSALLASVNGGKEFDVIGATCPDVAVAFKAAATAKAAANNRSSTGDSGRLPLPQTAAPRQLSMAEINAANRKYWAQQGPRA